MASSKPLKKKEADPKPDTTDSNAMTSNTLLTMGQQMIDSIVLEEDIDPEYKPTNKEVEEYAMWLGMDLIEDKDLLWIVREGLKSPLPDNWKPCKTVDTEEIYYFNFQTGESTWDHPCDAYYRKMYEYHKRMRRLSKVCPRDRGDIQKAAERDLFDLFPSGNVDKKIKSKKARVSSALNDHYGKDDSPRPNKKAAKGLRDLTSSSMAAPRHLSFSANRSTLCIDDVEPAHATSVVPAVPDTTVRSEEPLASGIAAASSEQQQQHFSLREEPRKGRSVVKKDLQHVHLRPTRELEAAETETEKGGQGRLKVLHDKIISEEENQKADANYLHKLDATRAEVESKVEKLEKQLKDGRVVPSSASASGVEKDEAAIAKEQQVSQAVRDEFITNDQVAILLKKKAESLETVVETLKEKLNVQSKEKEEAECAKQDALNEVYRAKIQVECLQAAEIILKDELKREKKDKKESQRVAKDSLNDIERAKVRIQHELLDYKHEAEELRAKLEEVQQLESERRAETEKLRAKQIENERRLKDGNSKLVESRNREKERKKEIERLLNGQIETERMLKNKEAKLKKLPQLESKRRAETGRLKKMKMNTERRLKDEEEKMSRAKKDWDIKMEKAQKEMCKFVADAKLQAVDLQKQISSLREAGVSKRTKADKAAPKHPSSTAGVIPSEELRMVVTGEEQPDAALEVKRLTEEVLTLETALAQSKEIDASITSKLHESEDQTKQLKQQLKSYHGLEEQSEKRIEELNQSFQSSQKMYKQSLKKVHTLEVELTTCRCMLQTRVDRERETTKNEKKAWLGEKLELEHTVDSLRIQIEALTLVVKENEETAKKQTDATAALLEGALMREEKLRNELSIAEHKQKYAAEEVNRVEESWFNREMEAKTSAEILSKGFMQAALASTVALSEVEAVLVNSTIDGEPPLGASSSTCTSQFLAKVGAKISSSGKGNGVGTAAATATSRTDTNITDACITATNISFEEDSEKIIDLLKSETLKLSSSTKDAALKLINDSQSREGIVSCLRKKLCDSEERERTLNAAVQRGAEKLEALQAELLDSKVEHNTACVQLSSSREDPIHYQSSSSSMESQQQAKNVTAHATLEMYPPTPGYGGGSCSSELHYWKERLRAEEQLLRSSGRALKNQKDHVRIRQSDLKQRRDEWRREWSKFEESIAARKKSELESSTIGQQRESFSASKKSLDEEICALNAVTSQIKESSRWLKHREQKVKELSEAITRASAENEGLLEMTLGLGPAAAATNDYMMSAHSSCLPSHSTCNSNKSSGEEGGGSSSFASTSVRRILHNLQEDVKELQGRMNRAAVPDPETPLNNGTQAAAFHAFQQQLPPLPPLYVIPPLAGYTYGFHVPAPPDVLPTASARPRPHHHQHGYYASYPHKQPFPVFHDPENLESSLQAWLNTRGRERPNEAAAASTNKPSMTTTTQPSPPNFRQISADRREAHLAVSEAVEKLSGITADMGVHRFGALCAVAATSSTTKEAINDLGKKTSGSLSGSAAVRGLNDATKAFTNTMGRATAVR